MKWTTNLMMGIRQINSIQFSPDSSQMIFIIRDAVMMRVKSEYKNTLYMMNSDGTDKVLLLDNNMSPWESQWSPCGKWISFISNKNGKQNIWLLRKDSKKIKMLTDVVTSVTSYKWSPDGKSIAYTTLDSLSDEELKGMKEKNDSYCIGERTRKHKLYLISAESNNLSKRQCRILIKNDFNIGIEGYPGLYDWSPSGKQIVFTYTRTPNANDFKTSSISLLNISDGSISPLVNQKTVAFEGVFSPDGKRIVYAVSDVPVFGCDYRFHMVDLSTRKYKVLSKTFDYRPSIIDWSVNSNGIYYKEQNGVSSRLCYLPISGKPKMVGPKKGVMLNGILDKSRKKIAFVSETADLPPEIFISPVESFIPIQITHINKKMLRISTASTKILVNKTKDKLEIESLLTLPNNYKLGKNPPLVVSIHGGPAGVFSESFIGTPSIYGPIATFASLGYAVLRCNVRGSTGYGKEFRHANYQDWGGKDFQDILICIKSLIKKGIVDKERIAVLGWSYGGYLTASAISQTTMFKAAIIGAGITDLISNALTCDIPDDTPNHFNGQVWEKTDLLIKKSPVFNVAKITTPTLILHGEYDSRVPLTQGVEFYNALKRKGCKVEMIVYPRTYHAPHEPKHLKNVMDRMLSWIKYHV